MAITRFDALRTLAFGGISGTYAVVGSATTHSMSMLRIINNTNGDLFISVDGTTNNLFLPANSFVLYDLAANGTPIAVNDNLLLQVGTQFYCKQSTAPSSGALWIELVYAKGD